MKTPAELKFVPFDKSKLAAETVFRAKSADGKEADAVLNQFGQVIDTDKRQLLGFEVKEMAEYPPKEKKPA